MWVLYVVMALLFVWLIMLFIPSVLEKIVEIKNEWELFKYRMRKE